MRNLGSVVKSAGNIRVMSVVASVALSMLGSAQARASDVSAPAMLEWFEGTYNTIERRTSDFFAADYGGIWTPPPGRADSGNFSVGYDQYNRFDVGKAGLNKSGWTLYGTENGLKATVSSIQKTGANYYLDLVWNHDGFRNSGTANFASQGGYPGFVLSAPGTTDGDFHSSFAGGDLDGRLAGLIDIDQGSNNVYIRQPTVAGPQNIPAGTIANIPSAANARFYPDTSGPPSRYITDPRTGATNVPVWDFNPNSPTTGTPVPENALGLLMRNAQWMVQTLGVDGFRMDAIKNYPSWVLNYYDRAVFQTSTHTLLNGQKENIFAFGEYFDGNSANIQPSIRKDINPATPNVVGGNRDALDFPLYFALTANLSSNGLNSDWNNVVNASLDRNDDGLANNGSQGVSFVQSADSLPPDISNVAYAYTLMRPGNTIVYYNAKEFGIGRDFPKDGRGDALGGQFGDRITILTDIRARYPQGNYKFRLVEKETLIIEREDSLVAAYSNRTDNGYDQRTATTAFAPGTPLIELTGNAANASVDPTNVIPELVVVNADHTVNLTVPRNANINGTYHGKGYVIYGPSGPQGALTLSNVNNVIAPDTATSATNGTARISSVSVIKAANFTVSLQTNQVNLLGFYRDPDADGDFAEFKVDAGTGGLNGTPSFVSVNPGDVSYGFQNFSTVNSPLIGGGADGGAGTGLFQQTINTAQLTEGYHYLEIRAFRHRNAGEPPIFSSWKQTIYVDRLPPNSAVASFLPVTPGVETTRRAILQSIDLTANNMHVLMDLPAKLTNAQVLAMISGNTNAGLIDRDQWQKDFSNVASGNHTLTIVTFEETGTANVQRYPGFSVQGTLGAGLGDLDFNNSYTTNDITLFANAFNSGNAIFNPAADLDADGYITYVDMVMLGARLQQVGAPTGVINAYNTMINGAIPEPAAVAFLAIPAALLSRRRRVAGAGASPGGREGRGGRGGRICRVEKLNT